MKASVVIIGAGPAGVMAAVQLTRTGKSLVIFESKKVGGLLNQAHWVENFPGFPAGIKGPKLADLLAEHLRRLKIKPIYEQVRKIKWDGCNFEVHSISVSVKTPYLIVASGTMPHPIPVELSPSLKPYVHSEITSLDEIGDSRIAVIGGGDAAFDHALRLAHDNHVFILNRSEPCCLPLLYERVCNHKEVEILDGASIKSMDAYGDGVELSYSKDKREKNLRIHHVLFAVGRSPNLGFIREYLTPAQIKTLMDQKRLYLVGDVNNGRMRQAAIAAGEGLKAAMEIMEEMGG